MYFFQSVVASTAREICFAKSAAAGIVRPPSTTQLQSSTDTGAEKLLNISSKPIQIGNFKFEIEGQYLIPNIAGRICRKIQSTHLHITLNVKRVSAPELIFKFSQTRKETFSTIFVSFVLVSTTVFWVRKQ